jgi:protein-disulfide isomerase
VKTLATFAAALLLVACSRPEQPVSPSSAPGATSAPAAGAAPATSAAPAEKPPLSADLQARLVRPGSPVLGRPTAKVTLVEFLDPACGACRAFAPVVKQVQFLYPDDVRVVVRLADFHPGSAEAIGILWAAQRQHRFDEVLTALFDRQDEWASHDAPNVGAAWGIAAAAGLDVKAARQQAASPEVADHLRQDREDITALQVERTPTFYVNGKLLEDFGADQLLLLVKSEVNAVAPAP